MVCGDFFEFSGDSHYFSGDFLGFTEDFPVSSEIAGNL